MKTTLTYILLLLYACVFSVYANSSESRIITVGNELDVAVTIFKNNSQNLLVWLPSEHGIPESVSGIAGKLANPEYGLGTEVWLADVFSPLFLPVVTSSINKLPVEVVSELLQTIHKQTGKRVFLFASGRGALIAMRATHHWLTNNTPTPEQFGGLILLHPNFFTETPTPGKTGSYYPIVHSVNVPIFLMQPENSPWRWQLKTLLKHLDKAGASTFYSVLPGIRDRFYFRPDATDMEHLASSRLAPLLQMGVTQLVALNVAKHSSPPNIKTGEPKNIVKKQAKLKVYQQDPVPKLLRLPNLNNKLVDLKQQHDKVVLVNFWASWCPPCVHEMPSMQKLYDKFKRQDFTILAVNMAEDLPTITQFLQQRVSVNFPILRDSDGKTLQRWHVYAFPSSYVIGKRGKIRYALFGAIQWDTKEVIDIISKLIKEK